MEFKRARTEEQRNRRRRQILATAAAMLAEMPGCSPPCWYGGPRCAT